jgi:hypothetical protein
MSSTPGTSPPLDREEEEEDSKLADEEEKERINKVVSGRRRVVKL